ncbi:MAG: kinase-regulated stress-responsive transcription factor skn7 [Geoglossum simile]|nr:MAG: kinase-regulated stress-responsive transcription factor skn7 [Geoglossum simile]
MDSGAPGGASVASSSSDFVRKLYKMLEDPAYDQIVRWGDGGDSFVVLENEKFTKTILPKHFKHSNFASFVRQLNKYDFHKVRHNNEENGQSPYGPGAWEFKHPEFQINNKDSLDNIRRKAPASRKSVPISEESAQIQQMDLVNSQLVATQQQLEALQDRYSELNNRNAVLMQELLGVQKKVVNHECVMQYVMSFLNNIDTHFRDQRRNSRINGPQMFDQTHSHDASVTEMQPQQFSPSDDRQASPLQHAQKLLEELPVAEEHLEQMNELFRQVNGVASILSDQGTRNGVVPMSQEAQTRPVTITNPVIYPRINGECDTVYPAGQTNGIDPAYSGHYHSVPYPIASGDLEADSQRQYADGRKKSVTVDPGWVRAPQILLVEDDPTCRRIGGKFLYHFKCAIDTAFDGLEAIEKMTKGSKYDLVLMDIIMPNLDGVSACRAIRQYDSTPIVAMTSNIRNDDINMYFSNGMNDVLPKPFTKEGLLTLLEKHLNHLKQKHPSPQTKSPASSWHSPSQLAGTSPTGVSITDESYANAVRGSQSHGLEVYTHRRTVSEMSGPDESGSDSSKRARVFVQPNGNTVIGPMQRVSAS